MGYRNLQRFGDLTAENSLLVGDIMTAKTETRSGRIITVFGGSGFVGRYVVRALARQGWRIRVASRNPNLAFHLQPLGRVGQVHAVQANLRDPASVAAALKGSQAVVNLVGILSENGSQKFRTIQAQGAGIVAKAAREAGVRALVHMSAIGADENSASVYARTKGEGERLVCENFPNATILRPSLVFGPEDDFFNRFAAMARLFPVMPLIGGGATKFQPVYVGDVAQAVATSLDLALEGKTRPGLVLELGGPEVKTFAELLHYICDFTHRSRLFAPIPFGLAKILAFGTEVARAASLGLFPAMLRMTRDQVELLRHDNIVSPQAIAEGRTLTGLGLRTEAIETQVPSYLYRFRSTGQFARQGIA